MVSASTPTIERNAIDRHAGGIYPAMAMLAGMQLDVFTPLKDGPLSASDIAAAIGVKADKLTPLLYALVVAELLTVDGGRFGNTPEADVYLVRGRASYLRGQQDFYANIWEALLKTAATIRTGVPQHKHDFHGMTEEEMTFFFGSQHRFALTTGEQLANMCNLSRYKYLLDVGAGSGGLAISAARACPELAVTAVDLPRVIPITRRFLKEESATDRITTIAADLLTEPPAGRYDVAAMQNIIQVLGLGDALTILRNVASCLEPGGVVLIVATMMENSRLAPTGLVGQNLVFLNFYDDGLVYTEGEYRTLLADAGFVDTEVRHGAIQGQALVSARKPA
jgi:precorrin-6B methylase 2